MKVIGQQWSTRAITSAPGVVQPDLILMSEAPSDPRLRFKKTGLA